MISQLRIKNLALIEELTVQFDSNFSIFTGETGAGKSILIGAIGLLLGDRASADSIRNDAQECEVCGIFELSTPSPALHALLSEYSIPVTEAQLIIRRILAKNGKNKILVNQVPLPVSALKEIGNYLIDFHGQHEHQSLLMPDSALLILNRLPGCDTLYKQYRNQFEQLTQHKQHIEQFDRKKEELIQKKEFLEFQFNELQLLQLKSNEETDLEGEYRLLNASEELRKYFSTILSHLEDTPHDTSVIKKISSIKKSIEHLSAIDSAATSFLSDVEQTNTFLIELNRFCQSSLQKLDGDAHPQRLNAINDRLSKIQRLKKKYHCSFLELIEKQKDLSLQLSEINTMAIDRNDLVKKYNEVYAGCKEIALELSRLRLSAAQRFDRDVSVLLQKLGFNSGEFKTTFLSMDDLSAHGLETIRFDVKTNLGQPFYPLSKTASGGEISRIMLAIKTVLSKYDAIPILIFDEIDTGIGGITATEVAKALYQLSKNHQVICISHLHQIASLAKNHYRVLKSVKNNATIVSVKQLSTDQKIEEIARMLGSHTAVAKKHAQELVAEAEKNAEQ